MSIIVGIDGTGGGNTTSTFDPMWKVLGEPSRNARYDAEMAQSFVHRLTHTGKPNHKYLRGPATFGHGLVDAVEEGYNFAIHRARLFPNEAVLLTGFSRGAAGAVAIAQKLARNEIEVSALLLFDCVCRHMILDTETIPNNVLEVLHLRRDPASGSRESFGNSGTSWNPGSTIYHQAFFLCTHGGVGGTPWKDGQPHEFIDEGIPDGRTNVTFSQDARVSETVWQAAQPFIRAHGFNH